jgi:hypothetical protein
VLDFVNVSLSRALQRMTIALQNGSFPLHGFLRRCFTIRRFAANAVRVAPFSQGINDELKLFFGYESILECLI